MSGDTLRLRVWVRLSQTSTLTPYLDPPDDFLSDGTVGTCVCVHQRGSGSCPISGTERGHAKEECIKRVLGLWSEGGLRRRRDERTLYKIGKDDGGNGVWDKRRKVSLGTEE